jgi:broad specificity phosphatase PhoE
MIMGKPRLIIIIRHAQSEGNKDKTIHQNTPDHKVAITPEGHEQARQAGEKLRQLLRPDDTLHFFISPYKRTRQTTEGMLSALCSNDPAPSPFQRSRIKVYEEPRLREQDFGNFQPGTEETERLWRERAEYGHFFYRIPNGESGADVYDRITSFNGSLWRRFSEDDMASVAVLVTHGLCSRVFLMAWYHYSVEFFEDLRNINHCEFLVMKHGANGRYVLQNELRRWTDLRRERAARRSVTSMSNAQDSSIPHIPVRRWASQKSANDATGTTFGRRPARQNTADLFKDDEELRQEEEDIESAGGAEIPVEEYIEAKQAATKHRATFSPMRKAPSPLQHRISDGPGQLRVNDLGRDGGGSRSGAASPHNASDEENGGGTPSAVLGHDIVNTPQHFIPPRSLAKALRGDFDDPNRVLADALGDQSDAEVDEADIEVGTKQREESEMRQILADERKDRNRRGSAYDQ